MNIKQNENKTITNYNTHNVTQTSKENVKHILLEVVNELQEPKQKITNEELATRLLFCIKVLDYLDNKYMDDLK